MRNVSTSLSLITLALIAAPVFGQATKLAPDTFATLQAQEPTRLMAAQNSLGALRYEAGLGEAHAFKLRNSHTDAYGETHSHFRQHYRDIPVFGAGIITHMDRRGNLLPATDGLVRDITVNTQPNLTASEALATAHGHLRPQGDYAAAPTVELVVYPVRSLAPKAGRVRASNAEDFENQVVSNVLAYHVHTSLRNEGETKDTDYIIDAQTGSILATWDDLHTTAAVGTGASQFSGTVSLGTNLNGSTYELKDVSRGMQIATYNLNHATSGTGTLYTDADDAWGNGANYTGSTTATTSATGQTAAVDAHYGIELTYDFYNGLFSRNGIDGTGKATYSRVHYSTSYDNAFWDDTCFCMTYGDGSSFKSLEAPDVAGHEMSHGVCANTAGLNYSGESGGLNEANSDMFGNMVELYGRNGHALPATVANTDACWTVGEQLSTTPLRYMYKPSLDGSSPNAWSSTVGNLDVHYSSGPANRMFFFLSQGASSSTTSNYYSSYAPAGFAGVGPEKAIRIWYKALTSYMTATTNYAGARTAALSAASSLYGATSAEYAAVQNAFAAINVGALAPTGVSVAITPATVSLNTGATQQFTAAVSGSSTTTVTWTCTAGTVTSAGLYTAPATAGTYTVTATSTADTTKSASATVTVGSVTPGSQLVLNPGFESGATSWSGTTASIGAWGTSEPAHAGTNSAWLGGTGKTGTKYVYQTVTIPSTATTATLTYYLHIDTKETTTTKAYDTFKAQVNNASGTALTTLSTLSNLNKATGFKLYTFDLSAYKGQTVQLYFTATEDSSLATSFVLDDVNLNVK
jgi:Zn-dependent metalloprotease